MKKLLLFICITFFTYTGFSQFDYSERNIVDNKEPNDVFVFADLNGDGSKDIITATSREDYGCYEGWQKLGWSENDGTGKFGKRKIIGEYDLYELGYENARINEIIAADYDNDGDNDITVLIRFHFSDFSIPLVTDYVVIFLYKNNGDGTFQSGVEIFNQNIIDDVELADMVSFDMDNDSDTDIFISITKRFYILKNLGSTFANPTSQQIDPQRYYQNIQVADINNDGFKDLVACSILNQSFLDERILVLMNNNGILNFNSTGYTIETGSTQVDVLLSDIDDDSNLDILSFQNEPNRSFYYHLNTGTGGMNTNFGVKQLLQADLPNFSSNPNFKSFDIDGDNDNDIIYSTNTFQKIINNGNLSFESDDIINNPRPRNRIVDIQDVDGDNKLDMVSRGAFVPSDMLWYSIDFNTEIEIGDIIYTESIYFDENGKQYCFIKDVDGDGDNDIVTKLDYDVDQTIYYGNNGDGNFSAPHLFSKKAKRVKVFQVADFNADGILDLVTINYNNNNITLFLRYADGSEEERVLENRASDRLKVFDYEGDGDIDINSGGNLLQNDGAGNFTQVIVNMSFSYPYFDYEDVNGDDVVDSYLRVDPQVGLSYFTLRYSTSFNSHQSLTLHEEQTNDDGVYTVKFIDYDHDGNKDILYITGVRNGQTLEKQLFVNYNLGNNQFSEDFLLHTFPPSAEDTFQFEDLDYNGALDILIVGNESISYILQNTDGTFTPKQLLTEIEFCEINSFPPLTAKFSDIDGDGIKDLTVFADKDIAWIGNSFIVDPNLDFDEDGIVNSDEDLNVNGNYDDDDTDGDGIPNYFDVDDDGDTVNTEYEITGIGAGITTSNYIFIDTDGDLIENYLDNNDDGDDVLTIDEDYNGNGNPIDDDTNLNGIPDFLDDQVSNPIIVNLNPDPLIACDDDNDGFWAFELSLQTPVITISNPSLSVTYHTTLINAENASLPLPNLYVNDQIYFDQPILDVNNPQYGTGGVWARVTNASGTSVVIVPFALEVRSAPVGNTPEPFHICDDNNDGFAFFDLTTVSTEVLGSLNPAGFDLYYYEEYTDATAAGDAAATNPDFSQAISDPSNFFNSSNPQVIYILLVSNSSGTIPPNPNSAEGCYDIVELELYVDQNPPDYGPFEMILCDDDLQGSTLTDGISTFDLTSLFNEIVNGDPSLTVEWFFSYTDEAADLPIPNPSTFQNNSAPQTVIARVTSAFGCKTLVTITLVVLPNPSPNMNPTPLEVCDDDNDGFSVFDLNSKDAEIISGQNDVEITYHETLADAQNGIPGTEIPSPYINIVPFNQVVYARVANLVPPNPLSCYTIVELELIVTEIPQISEPNNLFIDEGDGDGFAIFDLTVNIPVMLAGLNPADYTVNFYLSSADASNNINPIIAPNSYANTSNPQDIYVRVDNVITGCSVVTSFEILTDETSPDSDGDGIANEDEDLNNNGNLNDDDTDGDGIPNYLDSDDDGDTVETIDEITGIGAGVAPGYIYIDTDGDTIENYLDNDDDGDGSLTIDEDYNNNGNPIDDDTNGNDIPDFLDDAVFLSVNSFDLEDLSIFPNPTSESFTIKSSKLISETTVSIYDVQGKLLVSSKMIPQNGQFTMNISSLENGVYFVKISLEGNSIVKKLLKN